MEITDVKVNKVNNPSSESLKAMASVIFDNVFVVNSIRIYESPEKGPYVLMPSYKSNDEYKDTCHPITKEFRQTLYDRILEEYQTLE